MAVAVSAPQHDVWGRHRVVLATITFDDDLDEVGEQITPAQFGLSEFKKIVPFSVNDGYLARASVSATGDSATLYLYAVPANPNSEQPLALAGDNLDASSITVEVLVIGI